MIIRLVKMTFRETEVKNFLQVFETSKNQIRAFPGCHHVELLQDVTAKNIFFTYSIWDSEDALEQYRNSELFKKVWKQTKALFEKKAQAWSTTSVSISD